MDLHSAIDSLSQELKNEDWFFDISIIRNEIVVYAYWMNAEVMNKVPSSIGGYRVLLHFAICNLQKDYKVPADQLTASGYNSEELAELIPLHKSSNTELISNLDCLEKICGAHILESIFFEEHDGKNAITNWSNKYPKVRQRIHHLYEKYGFDAIYDEIEITL